MIAEYNHRFQSEVLLPAMQKPRGLPRLHSIFENWLARIIRYKGLGASIYEAVAFNGSGLDAELRQSMADDVGKLRATIKNVIKQATDAGHFRAGTDPDIVFFELQNLLLGTLYQSNYIRDRRTAEHAARAYERIIQSHSASRA